MWTAKDWVELCTAILAGLTALLTAVGGIALKILQELRNHEDNANARAALRGDPVLPAANKE